MSEAKAVVLDRCEVCNKMYPRHLVNILRLEEHGEVKKDRLACPICGLREYNQATGKGIGTPFAKEEARLMHQEAINYDKNRR